MGSEIKASRKWWIDPSHSCQMGDFFISKDEAEAKRFGTDPILVIEKSAYDKAISALKFYLQLGYEPEGGEKAAVTLKELDEL